MTVHADERTLRIAARIDEIVAEQVRLEAARAEHLAKAEKADAEIMRACKAVGLASDEIAQAQFAGAAELPARRRLERAAAHLANVMRNHGRGM
jgi:hypothetical protein